MNNRELKFRAWDSRTKKWLFGYEYPNLGGFSMKGEVMCLGEYLRFMQSVPIEDWGKIILMQYTGLKDKNGKEIYEGDIVKWGHTKRAKEFLHRVAVVEINPDIQLRIINYIDSFTKKEILTDNYIFHWGNFAYNDKDLEIIGNIYENKNLTTNN